MTLALKTEPVVRSVRLLFLLLGAVCSGFAFAGQARSFIPLMYGGPPASGAKVFLATTKVRSTAVRANPADNARLVGYVPGGLRFFVYRNRAKNGWVPIAPDGVSPVWRNGHVWVKRRDVAMREDYRPFDGVWPLLYMEFATEYGGTVWVFPPDNHCTKKFVSQVAPKIEKTLDVARSDISCQELWMVPHSNLVYANPNNEQIDIWYDRKKGLIVPDTLLGQVDGSLIYGYRNGTAKEVDIEWGGPKQNPRAISTVALPASFLEDTKRLSKNPKMYDPIVRYYKAPQ